MRVICLGLLAACALAQSATASTLTQWGRITFMVGGWNVPSVGVQLNGDETVENPDGCPSDGAYKTDPAREGTELFNSMLLTAPGA